MKSWQPFEWIVASRLLRDGRWQTVFIIGGVAIGVAVIVFMSALLSGLQANFIRRVLTAQPHIQLLPPKDRVRPQRLAAPGEVAAATLQAPLQRLKSIDQWQAVAAQIRAMPEVVTVSPMAGGSALVVRGEASRAITLAGIDPALYFRIVSLPEKLVQGTARLNAGDMLIGTELAADLGLSVGDKLRATASTGADMVFTISGVFDLGNKGANQRNTFVALHTAQSLLGLQGGVSSLDVTVRDIYAADDVAHRITARTGVQADSWIQTNAQFFSAVQAQVSANTAIRFFVGLSVAFGIASVLFVSVVQRSREIGILRAMGVTRQRILRLFLLPGGLLGLAGSLVGCLVGALALLLWRDLARGPDGLPLVPVTLEATLFSVALLLATVTGVLAAVAPALRAARLDPVVAIRG